MVKGHLRNPFKYLLISLLFISFTAHADNSLFCHSYFQDTKTTSDYLNDFISQKLKPTEDSQQHQWSLQKMNQALAEEVFEIIEKSYKKIGMPIQNKSELFDYNSVIIDRSLENNKILSVALFKETSYGAKLALIGSDGSGNGKNSVKNILYHLSNSEGIYAEVSLSAGRLAFKNDSIDTTPYNVAEYVLSPKPIRRPTEEELIEAINEGHSPIHPQAFYNSYIRTITIDGQPKTLLKVMIGHPLIPQHLKRQTPVVPWEFGITL